MYICMWMKNVSCLSRNFPTAQTVQRKQRLQEQRRQAGNVADTPLYRYTWCAQHDCCVRVSNKDTVMLFGCRTGLFAIHFRSC